MSNEELGPKIIETLRQMVDEKLKPAIEAQLELIPRCEELLTEFELRIAALEVKFGEDPLESVDKQLQQLERRMTALKQVIGRRA